MPLLDWMKLTYPPGDSALAVLKARAPGVRHSRGV
jgi:hypothetical protein